MLRLLQDLHVRRTLQCVCVHDVCALNRAGNAVAQASGAQRKRGRSDTDLEDTDPVPGM